jgi:glucose 1-dehydrogenase
MSYSPSGKAGSSALGQQLGGTYRTGAISDLGLRPDIVVECTGVVDLVLQAMDTVSPGGIVCLTGIGSANGPGTGSATALANDVVLKNIAVFGSVNANRRHYYRAATALAKADRSWLEQLVARRVPPDAVQQALQRAPDDIKVILEFTHP